MRRRGRGTIVGLLPALAGCAGSQSALDPAGPQAGRIFHLIALQMAVCAVIFAIVVGLMAASLWRRNLWRKGPLILHPPAMQERRLNRWVIFGTILTTLVLFVFLAADFATGRAIHHETEHDPLAIKVTGHQWWWEVQYQDKTPSRGFTTANELHIPVGRLVRIDLDSADVIHSFWVPNLHGKRDAIPGHPTSAFLKADRAGTFRGQCAEFCGFQHAFMRMIVVAEPEEAYQRWAEAQRRPSAEPATANQKRGRDVFLGGSCVMCHTVRGTGAGSRVGPDLTHLAGRSLIAGVLPNARGHLAGWVLDPQSVKPGVRMPTNLIKPTDVDALVDYLSSLK